jgi:leucyl aminopeptidase (aminopeptidase T)
MTQIERAARTILINCLGLKNQESVLIVTEESLMQEGEALWKYAKKLSKKPLLTCFYPRNSNLQELPKALFSSFGNSDSVIFLTKQLVNEKIFDEARQIGSRIIVLQNASKELIERSLIANYNRISNLSRRLAEIFTIGKDLYLSSPSGTKAKISIFKRKGTAETGLVHQAGDFTYLPAGEACLNLSNNQIEGRINLDGIAGNKKLFSKPIVLFLKNNQISRIKGEKAAEQLRKELRKFGKNGRKIHEIGVGTNDKAVLGFSAQEDEKALGTLNIAFGQNHTTKAKGKLIQAIKGIILNPTVRIDGKLIIEDGNILV